LISSLHQLCDIVLGVAISNASKLQEQFLRLTDDESIEIDPEPLMKIFSFMNWTFVQGIWSNLQNTRLRQDLQSELKNAFILKLARKLCNSDSAKDSAAKAVFLTEEFNSYLSQYLTQVKMMGYADDGTARLFALERIQEKFEIADYVMNQVITSLLSDEKLNTEVGSVAMQLIKADEERKKKGFFRRLFGL